MTTRNGQFRVSPQGGQRAGRYVYKPDATDPLPLFVPVVTTGADDGLGRAVVELATGDIAKPLPGKGGVAYAEIHRLDGMDPVINTYSDADTVAPGRPVQVISGSEVKIALRTTDIRTMVAGAPPAATPTVAVGDTLSPGTGSDGAGYWAETSTAANAWLIVTGIDGDWVECRLNF